jgi:4-hydroxybenzoyl-CoA thioesterase
MITFDRPVRFEDVDAAQIVFFARFFGYCHDALEAFFAELEGGYSNLVMHRHVGFPAVHVESDFKSPLKYGDTARIAVSVTKIGTKSATFRFDITRNATTTAVATVIIVHAITDLTKLRAIDIPADVRALLEKHLA